jgi:hypothetical protein
MRSLAAKPRLSCDRRSRDKSCLQFVPRSDGTFRPDRFIPGRSFACFRGCMSLCTSRECLAAGDMGARFIDRPAVADDAALARRQPRDTPRARRKLRGDVWRSPHPVNQPAARARIIHGVGVGRDWREHPPPGTASRRKSYGIGVESDTVYVAIIGSRDKWTVDTRDKKPSG